ncbi:Pyridine nucleotide-disulfide oxidoreductase domain-containing protein [Thalictrum thalictroides]|uniref:Pyridine nucleotide-disulfide oxidoreductase domain-containing protein 2 n=1 Tax=Thalictrum thalictroides TaxID=46969 RepID=A0A7J6UW94_THATH|nr:Pyridine nucleotide-disulfide oxidoreductase domain-containing protein [Thalictrum thalictroides]
MGETDGDRGVWSYVEGGMGAVSSAISKAAREAGAHIITNTEVAQLIVNKESGAAEGVLLADGSAVHSSIVLSNATPYRTFMELVPQTILPEQFTHAIRNSDYSSVAQLIVNKESGAAEGVLLADGSAVHSSIVLSNATPYRTFMELVPQTILPEQFTHAIRNSDYSSGTTKINLAVDKLPQFQCCEPTLGDAGPQHVGTIHIGSESMEEIDSAARDAWNGLPSRRPLIEMTIPSVLDTTISPPGKHVINLFIQYTPYKPSEGSWEDPLFREAFAQRCFSLIDKYAPGFSSSIIGYDMLTPPDLEREFGLTGGNIFHGAMGLDSLFLMRPVKGWSGYRTPLRGLYICGSGAHPGGGVMGAPGRNAAHVVLSDIKKTLK